MEPNKKPHLVVTAWVAGQPVTYKRSLCGRLFLLPDHRIPGDAAAELVAAFQEHVGEEHAQEAKD